MLRSVTMIVFVSVVAMQSLSVAQTAASHNTPTNPRLRQRSMASDFLRTLSPLAAKEMALHEDLAARIREIGLARFEKQNQIIGELRANANASHLRSHDELVSELIRLDDTFAAEQYRELNSICTEQQMIILSQRYFQAFSYEKMFDPLAALWLDLSSEELAATRKLLSLFNAYREQLLQGPDPSLTGDEMEAKLVRLEARIWTGISPKKLKRSFLMMGLIGEEESLGHYLRRHESKREALIDEVPEFAIAQLRLEADQRRLQR